MASISQAVDDSRSQRLSKPRTNASSGSPLRLVEQHREPPSPISPSATYMNGDQTIIVPSRRRSRQRTRSKIRAYLSGASQDKSNTDASDEEDDGQRGLADIARGVKNRLSRAGTGSSISQIPSATASSTQLSTSPSVKLLLFNQPQVVDHEESARIALEIKEKAYADSIAAQNHVAPSATEDMHVDSMMSPIRRRSLYTPGIATRTPNDILRKPPPPERLQSQADRDYYFNPNLPQSSPLTRLAALEIGEGSGGRSTPSNLGYSHLGGLRPGTLRVTNGTPSPAPESINPLRMHPPSQESLGCDDFFTALEGGENLGEPHSSVNNHRGYEEPQQKEDSAVQSEQLIKTFKISRGEPDASRKTKHRSGSPLKYEQGAEDCHVVERMPQNIPGLSPYKKTPICQRAFSQVPDQALCIAQEYLQDLPSSPYSFSDSSSSKSPNFGYMSSIDTAREESFDDDAIVISRSQRPAMSLWRSFINDVETRHANEGTREAALQKLTANAATEAEFSYRPASFSTVSMSMDHNANSPESIPAKPNLKADSGYSLSESLKSLGNSASRGSNGLKIEQSYISRRRASRYISGPRTMPTCTPHGAANRALEAPSRIRTVNPLTLAIPNAEVANSAPLVDLVDKKDTKDSVDKSQPTSKLLPKNIVESRKLRKARPSSQPIPAEFIFVQCTRNISQSNIPPVPLEIVSKHIERLREFPVLEHTFPSLQHVRSSDSLSIDEPICVPIRFPSPASTIERGNSVIRANLDWPSSRSIKSMKSKRSLHKSSTSPSKAQRRISQSQNHTAIADFGTVTRSLGVGPYDIARPVTVSPWTVKCSNDSNPRQASYFTSQPRVLIGMDEEVASRFARARSMHKSKSFSRLFTQSTMNFDDRGGASGKPMRPHSMFVDVPPVPALPTQDQIDKKGQSLSKSSEPVQAIFYNSFGFPGKPNRPQSMFADAPPVLAMPTNQEVVQRETKILSSNSVKSSALPPPLQIKKLAGSPKPDVSTRVAVLEEQERAANPLRDWESLRRAWNQRRKSAGDALLLRSQTVGASGTPFPSRLPYLDWEPSGYTPYFNPSSANIRGSAGSPQNATPPIQPLSQPQNSSSSTSPPTSSHSFSTPRKHAGATTVALEHLTDRYAGGLSYGYEPGLGLGGSAGTRNMKTGASRKSLGVSRGYGVDLSDVPIFVMPSK